MTEPGIKQNEVNSDLDLPIWSVVAFDRCEASGLTFAEASKKLAELETQKIAGLCLITDEAASRISP
jgi:hypothetical protein